MELWAPRAFGSGSYINATPSLISTYRELSIYPRKHQGFQSMPCLFQRGLELMNKPPDCLLIAAVVRPLTNPLGLHQARAGEQRQIRRDGRLGEPALLLN